MMGCGLACYALLYSSALCALQELFNVDSIIGILRSPLVMLVNISQGKKHLIVHHLYARPPGQYTSSLAPSGSGC